MNQQGAEPVSQKSWPTGPEAGGIWQTQEFAQRLVCLGARRTWRMGQDEWPWRRLAKWAHALGWLRCYLGSCFKFLLLNAEAPTGCLEVMPLLPQLVGIPELQPAVGSWEGTARGWGCQENRLLAQQPMSRQHREPTPGQDGCLLCSAAAGMQGEWCACAVYPGD